MTTSDLVNNFVSQFNKPFDLSMISNMINREPEGVREVLKVLLAAEKIKLVDPEQGIYVRSNRYSARVGYNQKGNWTFDPLEASALMDVIESGTYSSTRAIAKAIGRSRQWVYVYLEALASLGCISLVRNRYTVISRKNIKDIGKQVKPGILGIMRAEDKIEVHAKQEEEKARKRQIAQAKKDERDRKRKLSLEEQAIKEEFVKVWNDYLASGKAVYLSFDEYLKNWNTSK